MARARSRLKVGRGYNGPLPPDLWLVVTVAWEHGIAVSANFARQYAPEVALAASLGWISTVSLDGTEALRHWNVTQEGVTALNNKELT